MRSWQHVTKINLGCSLGQQKGRGFRWWYGPSPEHLHSEEGEYHDEEEEEEEEGDYGSDAGQQSDAQEQQLVPVTTQHNSLTL